MKNARDSQNAAKSEDVVKCRQISEYVTSGAFGDDGDEHVFRSSHNISTQLVSK